MAAQKQKTALGANQGGPNRGYERYGLTAVMQLLKKLSIHCSIVLLYMLDSPRMMSLMIPLYS